MALMVGDVLSRAMEMLGVCVTAFFLVLYDAQKAKKKKLDMKKGDKAINTFFIKIYDF